MAKAQGFMVHFSHFIINFNFKNIWFFEIFLLLYFFYTIRLTRFQAIDQKFEFSMSLLSPAHRVESSTFAWDSDILLLLLVLEVLLGYGHNSARGAKC